MRRQLMISALFVCSAAFVGCEAGSTQVADETACTMPECALHDAKTPSTAPAPYDPRAAGLTLPPQTIGSTLDRSTWARTVTYAPSPAVQHFPLTLRDVETPSEKRARKPEDPNETHEQRLDRVLGYSRAGNWNSENAGDAALQPLKFLWDVGTIWLTVPIDVSNGVPQTPDPHSDKMREKCILYP